MAPVMIQSAECMKTSQFSRRDFLGAAGAFAGSALLQPTSLWAQSATGEARADYTLTIATTPIEIAKDRILSVTTYNGQFPGPLLRFEGRQPVTVDIRNDTDVRRAAALAWADGLHGGGWRGGGGHAIYSGARQTAHQRSRLTPRACAFTTRTSRGR